MWAVPTKHKKYVGHDCSSIQMVYESCENDKFHYANCYMLKLGWQLPDFVTMKMTHEYRGRDKF